MKRPLLKTSFAIVVLVAIALALHSCAHQHSRPAGHGDVRFDISPNGKRLVFNGVGKGGRDVYLLDLESREVTHIAATVSYEVDPSLSPEGSHVVYAAGAPGERADHLYLHNLANGSVRQLTNEDANDSRPRFSPSGDQIVFMRHKTYSWGGKAANWSGPSVICVINADGTRLRQITPDGVPAYLPRFSPEGQSIRYWSDGAIYEVNVSNSVAPERLFSHPEPGVVLSPDESLVAFSMGRYSPDCEIYVSRTDGTQRQQVTSSNYGSFEPTFTPDGTTLFFMREHWSGGLSSEPKKSLWRVGIDGSGLQKIADDRLFDEPLKWKSHK